MEFVFSAWWFVLLGLILCVAGLIVGFVLMDKKDKAMIEEYKKSNPQKEEEKKSA